ncbi:mCG1038734, partial [Mus musculus]
PFVGRSDSFGLVCSDIWTLLLFESRGSQDRSENPYRAIRKYVRRGEGLKKKKEKERRHSVIRWTERTK